MAELADAPDLGSGLERGGGSNPLMGIWRILCMDYGFLVQ